MGKRVLLRKEAFMRLWNPLKEGQTSRGRRTKSCPERELHGQRAREELGAGCQQSVRHVGSGVGEENNCDMWDKGQSKMWVFQTVSPISTVAGELPRPSQCPSSCAEAHE